MLNRPSDIALPEGFTWERVELLRARWHIAENMVPVALAPGVVAWGTIASVRETRLNELIELYLKAPSADEANRLAAEVEAEADRIGYDNHGRLWRVHTAVERMWS